MGKQLLCVVLFITLFTTNSTGLAFIQDEEFTVKLGIETLTPDPGSFFNPPDLELPFVLQFTHVPNEKERKRLQQGGLDFIRYVGGNAYLVKRNSTSRISVAGIKNARASFAFTERMKMSELFITNQGLAGSLNKDASMLFSIRFFESVSLLRALNILDAFNVEPVTREFSYGNSLMVQASFSTIQKILGYAEVERLEPGTNNVALFNTTAAFRSNVQKVRQRKAFLNADGSGINVGVFDGGIAGTHSDYENRITVGENVGVSTHAAHVTGTIAGAGILNGDARGMAPRANVFNYLYKGNTFQKMNQAIKDHGLTITNNSWGVPGGWLAPGADGKSVWTWLGDWQFGAYGQRAFDVDSLVRKQNVLIVFSAGNQRDDTYIGPHVRDEYPSQGNPGPLTNDLHETDGDYMSTSLVANAKNILTVGAVTDDDISTHFSSWGPTRDGRIKPDIAANGWGLLSTQPNDKYARLSGTSMSAPTASGIAALLTDYYSRMHGEQISSVSLKNLLIHSARDIGNPGPDFSYGHGIADAELAARIIRFARFDTNALSVSAKKKSILSLMIEGEIDNKEVHKSTFTIDKNVSELRATLVWHDPPEEKLVNNLDLWLKPKDGKRQRPFVLDSKNPSQDAKRKRNKTDNIENIKVMNPAMGEWQFFVKGKKVPEGPQTYSLIISASNGNEEMPENNEGNFTLSSVYVTKDLVNFIPSSSLVNGDVFALVASLTITDTIQYDSVTFGTITSVWTLEDSNGNEVFRRTLTTAHLGPQSTAQFIGMNAGYQITSTLPRGTYKMRVVATMYNGQVRTLESTFLVQ